MSVMGWIAANAVILLIAGGILLFVKRSLVKRQKMWGAILVGTALFALFGGSIALDGVTTASAVDVSRLDVADFEAMCSEDTSGTYTVCRATEANWNSTSYIGFNMTLHRADVAEAASCELTATSTDFRSETDTNDANDYNVIEKESDGDIKLCMSTSDACTTNYGKSVTAVWDRAVAEEVIYLEAITSDTAFANLNQYSKQLVHITGCGFDYVVEIQEI